MSRETPLVRWLPLLSLLCSLGCAANKDQFADHDWTKEPLPEKSTWREVQSLFNTQETDADLGNHELRGVRHDLTMSDDARPDARCSCVDAVAGSPDQRSKFNWAGERPLLSGSQLLFAFRTTGSECPADVAAARRPSIQAVDIQGRDVVVVIEELALDRPQALGAIVAQPAPGGALYIRSRTDRKRNLPYARPVGQQMCRVYQRPGGVGTGRDIPSDTSDDAPPNDSGW